jgi:hypothetical protein
VNKHSGQYFIGREVCKNYTNNFGGGQYLLAAIRQHGRKSFVKTILHDDLPYKTMMRTYHKLLDGIKDDPLTYNLTFKSGGFGYINDNKLNITPEKASDMVWRFKAKPNYKETMSRIQSLGGKAKKGIPNRRKPKP